MRCILFRSGGSQIDVALPVRDNGNPPDWLEVDGIHYKCQGRVEAVTGWIFQEKEKTKDGVTMAFGNEPVQSGSYAFKGLEYHVNDGVGEDLPASTSSVKYFRAKIADLEALLSTATAEARTMKKQRDGAREIGDVENSRLRREARDMRERIAELEVEVARLKGVIIENVKDLNASEAFSLKALAAQDREITSLKSDLKVGTDLRRQLQTEIDVLLSERK